MPLSPRLDDRTFADLVREGESLIPRYGGAWTDRNLSDPGITLVELFAWLAETAVYQLDRVPPASLQAFLRLLGECPAGGEAGPGEGLDDALARAVRGLRAPRRAVTAAEHQAVALATEPPSGPRLARAHFLRLEEGSARGCGGEAAAVVVVPDDRGAERPSPSPALVERVFRHLNEWRMLGTRVRVFGPGYVTVGVRATVARRRGSGLTRERVQGELARFLSPLEGGEAGRGWPFGRSLYRSELYQRLEAMPAVDHVEALELTGPGTDGAPRALPEVPLRPWELVHAPRAAIEVAVVEVS